MDFKQVFTLLTEAGFSGWAVLEWECCVKSPEQGAREAAPFIARHIIEATEIAFDDFAGSSAAAGCQLCLLAVSPDRRRGLSPLTEADRAQIKAFKEVHVKAFLAGDVAAAAATFADDAILLPPNAEKVQGIAKIKEALRNSMSSGLSALTLTPIEISGLHNFAYLVGEAEARGNSPATAEPISQKFVWVLKKQRDGSWKIAVDAWNNNKPPAKAQE